MTSFLARPAEGAPLRFAIGLSLAVHLLLHLIPLSWLIASTPVGERRSPVLSGARLFAVSLLEGPVAEAEITPAPVPIVSPSPAPAAAEPPSSPAPPPPEAAPVLEAEVVPPATPLTPAPAPAPAAPGAGGLPVTGTSPAGAEGTPEAAGTSEAPARYRGPRLLVGALPLSPEDAGADVPDEIPVRIRVGVAGRVIGVEPGIGDLPPGVLAAIRSSAEAMRFVPARLGDDPVEAWFSMSFIFRR